MAKHTRSPSRTKDQKPIESAAMKTGINIDEKCRFGSMENPLVTRYEQTGNIEYLQEAISLAAVALGETSDGQPNRACRSNNLANLLARRFDWFGAMDDLALAISLSEEAVRLSPLTHPS